MSETKTEIGWGNPNQYSTRSKFHYFVAGGHSLCGNWFRFPNSFLLEDTADEHSDNCAACKKKKLALNAQKAKATETAPREGFRAKGKQQC